MYKLKCLLLKYHIKLYLKIIKLPLSKGARSRIYSLIFEIIHIFKWTLSKIQNS